MSWTYLGIGALVLILISCVIGYRRGFVKEAVSTLFVILALVIVWFINPYVNQFLRNHTPVYEKVSENCHNLIDSAAEGSGIMDGAAQEAFLEKLDLPGIFTHALEANNNSSVYQSLGVTRFVDYVAEFLAAALVNALSFLISYILATIMINLLAYVLNLFASLPVIRGINKVAGALLAGGKCVLYIWIAMIVVTLLYETKVGQSLYEMIRNDTVLSYLYDHNVLMEWLLGVFRV